MPGRLSREQIYRRLDEAIVEFARSTRRATRPD